MANETNDGGNLGATRYVNLMFLQIFKEGTETRVLRRSEPLPAILTSEGEMVSPPPLEDVLNRLKTMCGLDPQAGPGLIEGTIDMFFKQTPYNALCRFDDTSDACCQIRLERSAE